MKLQDLKNKMPIALEVEIYEEDGEFFVSIADEGITGAECQLDSLTDIGREVNQYVENYLGEE